MTSNFGGHLLATRLNSFRAAGLDVAAAIRASATVAGIGAVELNYPQHLIELTEDHLELLLTMTGLRLTSLNLRYEGPQFANGALTNPDPAVRAQAIRIGQEAVALARRHGALHVIIWLADDGFDYPFQVDYTRLWADAIDGFRQIAAHDATVRVSVEYKPSERRRFPVVRSMADALLATREVDLPNFGVTLDVCHSLMAGEQPAAAATLALREGRLFGVHLNDGDGRADDGLLVGSIHPIDTLELLAVLRLLGYDGTLYFDTFPVREDPAAECAANVATVRRYEQLLDRLDWATLTTHQLNHDALAGQRLVRELDVMVATLPANPGPAHSPARP